MVIEKSEFELKKRQMMRKNRKARMKRRLIVFMFLFICAGIIFTVLKAPFFNIKTIVCVGQNELTEEQLIEIAQVKVGANIFSTGVNAMKRRLGDEPRIAECNVRRLFPNKIKIWVREAKAAVFVERQSGFLHIDKNGQIIKITDLSDADSVSGIARLADLEPLAELPGEYIFKKDDARAMKIFECINILSDLEMLDKVTFISAADLSDIRIDYQDRLYIMLGSYEQMEYKLTFIKKVISDNISEYEKALLDYRGKNLYVGPREKPEDKTEDVEKPEGEQTENPENGETAQTKADGEKTQEKAEADEPKTQE